MCFSKKHLLSALLGSAAAFGAAPALAINVTPTSDAFALANSLFLNVGGLAVQSAFLSGEFSQAGLYQNPQGTYGLPVAGIVLSSGNVSDYATGPNVDTGTSSGFGVPASADQEALLQPITGQENHFDPVQLSIEFFAPDNIDQVSFFGAFGSEEWPEFVGDFVDGFGLYVNGTNVAGVLPTGGAQGDPLLPVNIDHPDMRDIAGTELDGVLAPNGSPVLRFDVPVSAGELNEFEIIVADANDSSLDTTTYLSSFFAEPIDNSGQTEFDPLLPSNPPDPETGEFIIEIADVPEGQTVWIDPPVAVGYEYALVGDGEFASVTAPSLATVADLDGYFLVVGDQIFDLAAGETINLLAVLGFLPTSFQIQGIDPDLMLDPGNTLAFPLGVMIDGVTGGTTISITPIIENVPDSGPAPVPLPPAMALLAGAILVTRFTARRRA